MNAFTFAVLSLVAFAGIGGTAILFFRERILMFVRARYEKVYREDGLSEDEIRSRLPKMWVVVLIGIGSLLVAAIAAGAAWASVATAGSSAVAYDASTGQCSQPAAQERRHLSTRGTQ